MLRGKSSGRAAKNAKGRQNGAASSELKPVRPARGSSGRELEIPEGSDLCSAVLDRLCQWGINLHDELTPQRLSPEVAGDFLHALLVALRKRVDQGTAYSVISGKRSVEDLDRVRRAGLIDIVGVFDRIEAGAGTFVLLPANKRSSSLIPYSMIKDLVSDKGCSKDAKDSVQSRDDSIKMIEEAPATGELRTGHLIDGRVLTGCVLLRESRSTVLLIDSVGKESHEFALDDVQRVDLLPSTPPAP